MGGGEAKRIKSLEGGRRPAKKFWSGSPARKEKFIGGKFAWWGEEEEGGDLDWQRRRERIGVEGDGTDHTKLAVSGLQYRWRWGGTNILVTGKGAI